MRRSAFEAAGGFDEGYWMYMEDLDLSYRLAQQGWLSWYEPAATVIARQGRDRRRPAPARGSTGTSTAACTASTAGTTRRSALRR